MPFCGQRCSFLFNAGGAETQSFAERMQSTRGLFVLWAKHVPVGKRPKALPAVFSYKKKSTNLLLCVKSEPWKALAKPMAHNQGP